MSALGVMLLGVGATALLGIFGWAIAATYSKLAEIEKSLNDMRVEMAKIQSSLWSRDDIRELIQLEISKTLGKC